MRKAVILNASGNELANQLWNYASIYAYTLERGLVLENPSFFEYGNYFTMPPPNIFFKLAFFLPFTDYTKRKQSFKRRLWRKFYRWYSKAITYAHKTAVITSDNKDKLPFYLAPTRENEKLSRLEQSADTIYFDGWLFRNPVGLQKYRKEITEYFKPRTDIEKAAETTIKNLRETFKNIIGVHIRQGDYATWRGGTYFIPQTRVREIMDEYLAITDKNASEACFVITSDGIIDTSLFNRLHISVSRKNAAHDLLLLSKTDIIIGSNSTFGAFASYYGNRAYAVMQKGPMDWNYYKDKKNYFENKYATFVYY
ncbi:MAG: alpha-1,2-fucosyltransferase [Candidatus Sungbacteria bacterium]|nr:alpha-1,2-fucosyltransferase [Candidatus Sungbacteria bacterium]